MTQARAREKFIAVVGLPRSGTTLLSALLDGHSALCLYYEPWNASPKDRPSVPKDVEAFRSSMEARFGPDAPANERIVGFKETTTNAQTTAWAVDTVDALAGSCDVCTIWIQRNPIHCLLSKIEGARKWWGYPEAKFSKESLEQFFSETEKSYDVLGELQRRHGGLVVQYEELARDPARTLAEVMAELGIEFESSQLDYHESVSTQAQRDKIMGDPGLIENPSPVTRESIDRREREAQQHQSLIDEVRALERFAGLIAKFDRYATLPPVAKAHVDFEP